jgi:DNA-binding PadR family transcriptional regulator
MRTIDATPLEFALLGLLAQGPRSTYDLRKLFALTPVRHFSDSPGAIYPAVRRLLGRRWISAGAPTGARGRQELQVTDRGRASFLDWLRRPVTRDDVMLRGDELLMRFAFMGGNLGVPAITRFLKAYQAEMLAYLEVLRLYHGQHGAGMPLTGRLAFERGMEEYESCARWAASASGAIEGAGRGSASRGR